MSTQDAEVVSVTTLTLQEAYVLLYYWEKSKDKKDKFLPFPEVVQGIFEDRRFRGIFGTPDGFSCYDAHDKLVNNVHNPLLFFPVINGEGKPHANRHRLPEAFFRDPSILFGAINRAEEEWNRQIEENAKRQADPDPKVRANFSALIAIYKQVPLTKMPMDDSPAVFGSEGGGSPAQLVVGSLVALPGGGAGRVEMVQGELQIVPLKIAGMAPAAAAKPKNGAKKVTNPPKATAAAQAATQAPPPASKDEAAAARKPRPQRQRIVPEPAAAGGHEVG